MDIEMRQRLGGRLVALMLASMLLVTGCGYLGPSRPVDPVGVTLRDGDVVIIGPACAASPPARKVVEVLVPQEGEFLDADTPRVWKVVSEDPPRQGRTRPVEEFTVGVTPEGYEEVIPLEEPLEDDRRYVAQLTAGGSISEGFTVSELTSDAVWYSHEHFDPETFYEAIACPEESGDGS